MCATPLSQVQGLSPDLSRLIASMLEPSPEDRPTAEQLLQHPLLAPYLATSSNNLPVAAGAGAEAMAAARGAREREMERMMVVLREKLAKAEGQLRHLQAGHGQPP